MRCQPPRRGPRRPHVDSAPGEGHLAGRRDRRDVRLNRQADLDYGPSMAAQVREGLFFSTPAVLPRGRHGLPRDQVVAAQRERLMAAMTVLMADLGYEHVRVGDVASEAG